MTGPFFRVLGGARGTKNKIVSMKLFCRRDIDQGDTEEESTEQLAERDAISE